MRRVVELAGVTAVLVVGSSVDSLPLVVLGGLAVVSWGLLVWVLGAEDHARRVQKVDEYEDERWAA